MKTRQVSAYGLIAVLVAFALSLAGCGDGNNTTKPDPKCPCTITEHEWDDPCACEGKGYDCTCTTKAKPIEPEPDPECDCTEKEHDAACECPAAGTPKCDCTIKEPVIVPPVPDPVCPCPEGTVHAWNEPCMTGCVEVGNEGCNCTRTPKPIPQHTCPEPGTVHYLPCDSYGCEVGGHAQDPRGYVTDNRGSGINFPIYQSVGVENEQAATATATIINAYVGLTDGYKNTLAGANVEIWIVPSTEPILPEKDESGKIIMRVRVNHNESQIRSNFQNNIIPLLTQGNDGRAIRLAGTTPKAIDGWQRMTGHSVRLTNANTKRMLQHVRA